MIQHKNLAKLIFFRIIYSGNGLFRDLDHFKNKIYDFLENQACTKYPSFIPLEIEQNLPNNSCRDEIRVYSSLKVSNSSGLTIEFAEGCKLLELNAIIGVINATK